MAKRSGSGKSRRFGIEFRHSGVENVAMLVLILTFFAILAPLAHTQLPNLETAGPKNDEITGLALSNTMDSNITLSILIILSIAFLIPVELTLRKHGFRQSTKKKK